jgi:hypothetical protein
MTQDFDPQTFTGGFGRRPMSVHHSRLDTPLLTLGLESATGLYAPTVGRNTGAVEEGTC